MVPENNNSTKTNRYNYMYNCFYQATDNITNTHSGLTTLPKYKHTDRSSIRLVCRTGVFKCLGPSCEQFLPLARFNPSKAFRENIKLQLAATEAATRTSDSWVMIGGREEESSSLLFHRPPIRKGLWHSTGSNALTLAAVAGDPEKQ